MTITGRLAALSLIAAPLCANAQEMAESGKAYLAVKLGAVFPKHEDLKGFDNGFALEAAAGYRANENLALEVSVGRFSISRSGTYYDAYYGVFYTETVDDTAIPIMVTAKAIFQVEKLELYGLAGGGLYLISSHVEDKAAGYAPFTASDSSSAFGFHIGAGASLRFSPRASIGAEAKYAIGTVNIWDVDQHFDSIIVAGTLTYSP